MSDSRFEMERNQGKWRHMHTVAERFRELSKECGDAYGDACVLIVEAMGIASTEASTREVLSLFVDLRRLCDVLCAQREFDNSRREAVDRILRLLEKRILR